MPQTNFDSTEYLAPKNKDLLSESGTPFSTASRFLSDAYGWVSDHKIQLGTALAATAVGSAAMWRATFYRAARQESIVHMGPLNSWQIIRSGYRPSPEFNVLGSTNLARYENALHLTEAPLPKSLSTTLQKLGKDWR